MFWLLLVISLFVMEICARLISTRFVRNFNSTKERLSKGFAALTSSDTEPNMSEEDLKTLNFEYDEHVKLCVAHYGNWSTAIKSEDSIHMPEYEGKFLNVVSGLRVTTNSPSEATQRLYIFGGSTVFCGEVKDSLTMCSQLQSEINNHKFGTMVINFGRHGSTFRNRLLYLERCILEKGDLILFWFGVNELGWKMLEGKTDIPVLIRLFHTVSEGLKYLSKNIALVELISGMYDSVVLQPFYGIYAFFETKNSLKILDKLSNSRGFNYKVILQPNLLTKSVRTRREDVMLNFFMSRDKGKVIKKLFDANYPRFRGLLGRFNGVDGTDIFAQTDQEVFVDWVHLNSVGNKIAAELICDAFEADDLFEKS